MFVKLFLEDDADDSLAEGRAPPGRGPGPRDPGPPADPGHRPRPGSPLRPVSSRRSVLTGGDQVKATSFGS